MIEGKLIGGDELVSKLKHRGPAVRDGLTRVIKRLTLILLRNVKEDKLTGQVLNVRSGRLRRSINAKFEGEGTDQVTGSVGTNLKYGRAHEYGFNGVVNVKEHLRLQVMAFGKAITPTKVTVRTHTMKMNLPQKSFLRSALSEMGTQIAEELKDITK